jgi:hypothetical protein
MKRTHLFLIAVSIVGLTLGISVTPAAAAEDVSLSSSTVTDLSGDSGDVSTQDCQVYSNSVSIECGGGSGGDDDDGDDNDSGGSCCFVNDSPTVRGDS